LPSAVRGAGARRLGFPSDVRGVPSIFTEIHCAEGEEDNRKNASGTSLERS